MSKVRNEKPLCIIPARGNSKRLPRKNIKMLKGKPLLAYAIEAALKSKVFGLVCVSSEDDQILRIAEEFGAQFVHKRPLKLSKDKAQVREVCVSLLEYFSNKSDTYEEFGVLLPTNPLRTAVDVKSAYRIFKNENANFVMSLVPYSHPPQRAVHLSSKYIKPYFGIKYMKQTQRLDPLYRHDGSVIFAKSKAFLKTKQFYGEKVFPYFIPEERSVDIDTLTDFKWAEFLLSQ